MAPARTRTTDALSAAGDGDFGSAAQRDRRKRILDATLALACVSGDSRHANEVISKAMDFIEDHVDGYVTDIEVEILSSHSSGTPLTDIGPVNDAPGVAEMIVVAQHVHVAPAIRRMASTAESSSTDCPNRSAQV